MTDNPPIGPLCPAARGGVCRHASCWQIRPKADLTAVYSTERVDTAMVGWLQRHLTDLRRGPDAYAITGQIHRLRTRAERLIDNRDPDTYFGPCQAEPIDTVEEDGAIVLLVREGETCGADLIGQLDAATVTCTVCGAEWQTAEIEDWVTEKSRNVWATLPVIVDGLRARGEQITIEKARNWVSKDKLEHEAGRPRRVPYPPILQVGSEPRVDDAGRPVMQPLMVAKTDAKGETVTELGRPVMVQATDNDGRPVEVQATKPLYRLGDFLDRIEVLRQIDDQRRGRSAS